MSVLLTQLTGFASLTHQKVNLAMARTLLTHLSGLDSASRLVMIAMIQQNVAERFGLRPADLTSERRSKNIAEPRMIGMCLAKELTDHSLSAIGEAFGGRGHATVIHAINRVKKEIANNKRMAEDVEALRRQLRNS